MTKRYGRGNGPEFAMQKALFTFLRRYTPYSPLLFAVPNGAQTATPAERRRLVEEGMTSGIPDVYCSVPSGPYHGLYMELKCGDNTLSPQQDYYFKLFRALGYRCEEVKDDWARAKDIFFEHINGCSLNLRAILNSIPEPIEVPRGTRKLICC